MLFAVLFTDEPAQGARRAQHLGAHLTWIAAHQEVIRVAGSLRDEPADVPRGALWIVDAPSKAEVLALIESDPFSTCGLRASVDVMHWSKAMPERTSLV